MTTYSFCTISTESHLFKCFALAHSIAPWNGHLHILCVDAQEPKLNKNTPNNITLHNLNSLNSPIAQQIINKYHKFPDKLRWCLKSVFLLHLLETSDKIVYVDNDIAFFNNFEFLFQDLAEHPILLSPHHYPISPEKDQNWFEANFRVGLYNAGFLGANKNANDVLLWWAKACLYRCEKNAWRGLFDDQKYLDLVPIIEPNTKVLNQKGCNVAEWNAVQIKRTFVNGHHIVNNNEPLIFYHFNPYSLRNLDKNDAICKEYIDLIKIYKPDFTVLDYQKSMNIMDKAKLTIWKFLNKLN